MTFRDLLAQLAKFEIDNPNHEALDREVVVRVEIDDGDGLNVGSLKSVTVDAGCTEEHRLVLDADQSEES